MCLGGPPWSLPPSPQTLAPLSPRMSATATWSCSPPTSTSRPMVLKDSLSRCGEMGRRSCWGKGRADPWEAEGP